MKNYFHIAQKGKNASLQILNHCPARGKPTKVAQDTMAFKIQTVPIIHPKVISQKNDANGLLTINTTSLPNGL